MQIKSIIQKIQSRNFTNNNQRVGLRLLKADGEWVVRSQLTRIPSATARLRELRQSKFGGFKVECKSSSDLNRPTSKKTYYYRIDPNAVTTKQVQTLFGI